jgi:DNA repair exonuclease SbcCD ATPase subunit
VCPTCEQRISDEHRAAAKERAAIEEGARANAQMLAKASVDAMSSVLEELTEERDALIKRRNEVKAQLEHDASNARIRADLSHALENASAAVIEHTQQGKLASERVDRCAVEVGVLSAVERVLGLRGVRAHVLGKALSGIETIASKWLARIATKGMSVHLAPYEEKKTGGVKDAIALSIDGAGNGHGYKACSAGERRRIDLALLFALGEVAAAAHGQSPGTLWCDEIFDHVDDAGVDKVCETVRDLARDRLVVIISHNKHVLSKLTPDVHLRVDAGKVVRVS